MFNIIQNHILEMLTLVVFEAQLLHRVGNDLSFRVGRLTKVVEHFLASDGEASLLQPSADVTASNTGPFRFHDAEFSAEIFIESLARTQTLGNDHAAAARLLHQGFHLRAGVAKVVVIKRHRDVPILRVDVGPAGVDHLDIVRSLPRQVLLQNFQGVFVFINGNHAAADGREVTANDADAAADICHDICWENHFAQTRTVGHFRIIPESGRFFVIIGGRKS